MTLSELKNKYINELSDIYQKSEILFLLSIFVKKKLGFNTIQQKILENNEISSELGNEFLIILSELKTGKPYQYILGEAEFFGLSFFVNESVLIPRPETEELLELAILKISENFGNQWFKLLDIGSGSGIIPIVIKKNFPNVEVVSIDISEKAVEVARKNADFHNVSIDFLKKDYLNNNFTEKYDVIISNPPYIGKLEYAEIESSVKDFEPNLALFSPTEDPLIFYKKIAKDIEYILNPNGLFFLEINQKLGIETLNLYEKFNSELIKDLSGNYRFIYGNKN